VGRDRRVRARTRAHRPRRDGCRGESEPKAACTVTAAKLGNTPTVARNAYVHPAVVETYLDTHELVLPAVRASRNANALDADERRVLRFLERAQRDDPSSNRVALLERSVAAAERARANANP
jgi:DNA topoisomerase IB